MQIQTKKRNSREEPFKSSKILKIAKIWFENVVMCGKHSVTKFANFLIIVLRAESVTTFGSKMVTIFARNTMRKFANFVRLYLPHIQHFSTKFWNFTTFRRFFPGTTFLLSIYRSKVGLQCKLSFQRQNHMLVAVL